MTTPESYVPRLGSVLQAAVIVIRTMSEPRIPKGSISGAIAGLDEIEFIDRGGQGDAWRIRRKGGTDEFLKVIVQATTARVTQEIATMQTVDHPNVMGFTEAGSLSHEGTDHRYIIGEYVPGQSIGAHLNADRWPSEVQALSAIAGALRGMAAIHSHDLVHRDIKPGNIALRADDWEKPVVLDLGLVRDLLGDTITVYPNLLGTVPFMAPEQLRQEPAVRRSDVFASGVTLYYMLTKEHPFLSGGEAIAIEVLEERINDASLPDWENGIAEDVREVLAKMLSGNAYERPRADTASTALESIVNGR